MRIRLLVIIEGFILLLLALRLFTARPGFIPSIVFAVVFGLLAMRMSNPLQRQIFGFISVLAWIFIIVFVLTTGYFWLAIIWPIVWAVFFYRRGRENWRSGGSTQPSAAAQTSFFDRANTRRSFSPKDVTADGSDATVSADTISKADGNDVIDLAQMNFRSTGNVLNIKKTSGNTKILVPEDVAIDINIAVMDGLVRLLAQPPQLDAVHTHYISENFESSEKRVTITVHIVSGNVEVVRA